MMVELVQHNISVVDQSGRDLGRMHDIVIATHMHVKSSHWFQLLPVCIVDLLQLQGMQKPTPVGSHWPS